jgi:hypothetical protein
VHLVQAGVNLIYIRDLLRHADVSTTEICADMTIEERALARTAGRRRCPVPRATTESAIEPLARYCPSVRRRRTGLLPGATAEPAEVGVRLDWGYLLDRGYEMFEVRLIVRL